MKWMLSTVVLMGMVALTGVAVQGQTGDSESGQNSAPAQEQKSAQTQALTDVGISFYKTFTSTSIGNGVVQVPSNSAGGMLEVRHIVKPLVGYEFTYSFNPANQSLSPKSGDCGYYCQVKSVKLAGKASEIGLDWVASYKVGSFRPFVVAGLGFFITFPGYAYYGDNTVVRPTFIYGGGVDWNVGSRFGLRFQFRDNIYKAPDVYSPVLPPTGVTTYTAEPMVGAYYRF